MFSRMLSRSAPLVLVLVSACSASNGNSGPGHAGAAGTVGASGAGGPGGAGTTGAAGSGGGPAGTSGAAGAAGQPAAGTSGAAGSSGAAGTQAPGQDAATTDAPGERAASSDGGVSHVPFTGTVRIMVLGSSNEEGTCWRAFLQKKLKDNGVTNFDFVGRHNAGPACTGVTSYDKDCEAHGGTVVENISADAWATTFKANPPDIILQHNGGADLLNGKPYMNVINAYTLSVTEARKVNPRVVYLAAQHTPQGSANDVKNVVVLNDAMVPWGAGITTADSPVVVVDLFTGIDQKTDMSDGTHLNEAGSQKVADRWLAVLLPMLKP